MYLWYCTVMAWPAGQDASDPPDTSSCARLRATGLRGPACDPPGLTRTCVTARTGRGCNHQRRPFLRSPTARSPRLSHPLEPTWRDRMREAGRRPPARVLNSAQGSQTPCVGPIPRLPPRGGRPPDIAGQHTTWHGFRAAAIFHPGGRQRINGDPITLKSGAPARTTLQTLT
jgi:hypothetical protein